jgi:hypothetical protein
MAFLALAVDLGYIGYERTRCQQAADAASHAAACRLMNDRGALAAARQDAIAYAAANMPNAGAVLAESDVSFGTWDSNLRSFTPNTPEPNAVRAIARRSDANGNAIRLFFAPVIGYSRAQVSAEAITMFPTPGRPEFRFLIDDEMIDSDEPAIEALARRHGKTPDAIISDKDNDGWIDLPPGEQVELPTGQVGDEALFDRTSFEGAFPFASDTRYTMLDFLAEGTVLRSQLGTQRLKDVEWRSLDAPHLDLVGKKLLDPVLGIDPMSSKTAILNLPNPQATLVSPVFKSDVSMVERTASKYGSPAANVQGERRGLLAFKILSARDNPKGGSYLPLLTIEIVDPKSIDLHNLGSGGGTGGGKQIVIVN